LNLQQHAINIKPVDDDAAEMDTGFVAARDEVMANARLFTNDIEGFFRERDREGGLTRAPRSIEDLLRSALPVFRDIRDSLQHLVDVERYKARLPPLSRGSDDEKDKENDENDSEFSGL
jgi:hypothetical protein